MKNLISFKRAKSECLEAAEHVRQFHAGLTLTQSLSLFQMATKITKYFVLHTNFLITVNLNTKNPYFQEPAEDIKGLANL